MSNQSSYTNSEGVSTKTSSSKSLSWAPLALLFGIAFLPGCARKTACLAGQDSATLSCSPARLFALPKKEKNTLTVTATAYTAQSVGRSSKSFPKAANGERLTPDVNAIAVSPDLIEEFGLDLDKTVRLSGLEGEYKVMDLMSPRLSRTIDIYFGNDQSAAREWGRRTLTLSWEK